MIRGVISIVFVLAASWTTTTVAAPPRGGDLFMANPDPAGFLPGPTPQLAQKAPGPEQAQEEPLPGELIIPGAAPTGDEEKEKKCMTVCGRWGEECILVNKGAGGMERKCRRTCKQFTEECF